MTHISKTIMANYGACNEIYRMLKNDEDDGALLAALQNQFPNAQALQDGFSSFMLTESHYYKRLLHVLKDFPDKKKAFINGSFRWVRTAEQLDIILSTYDTKGQKEILLKTDRFFLSILHRLMQSNTTHEELNKIIELLSPSELIRLLSIKENRYVLSGVQDISFTLESSFDSAMVMLLNKIDEGLMSLGDEEKLVAIKDLSIWSYFGRKYFEFFLEKKPFDALSLSEINHLMFNSFELVFFKETAPWFYSIVSKASEPSFRFNPNHFPEFRPVLAKLLSDLKKTAQRSSISVQVDTLRSLDAVITLLNDDNFRFSDETVRQMKTIVNAVQSDVDSGLKDASSHWGLIRSMIKAVLGILACALVVPALCIEGFTQKGFKATFFPNHSSLVQTVAVTQESITPCSVSI